MPFNEGNMSGPEAEKKGKREMSKNEVESMGEEMEEYYTALRQEAEEIEKELSNPDIKSERAEELRGNLELIKEQLEEDWEGFVDDIKSGDVSGVKTDKE
ncbi:MAG: hypothetical protein ABIB72_01430 [Candidatus Falkowbacteria bacterium]